MGQLVNFLSILLALVISRCVFATSMLTSTTTRAPPVGIGPLLFSNRELIIALAARHAIPTMYSQREVGEAGGLMSYGGSLPTPIDIRAFTSVGSSKGRSRRPAGNAIDQIRIRDKPQDRETLNIELPPNCLRSPMR